MSNVLSSHPNINEINAVWAKGKVILGQSPSEYRMDDFGRWMRYGEYGNRNSDYGWEIDHRAPSALGGLDIFANKRPLNWKPNATLGGILGAALGQRQSR